MPAKRSGTDCLKNVLDIAVGARVMLTYYRRTGKMEPLVQLLTLQKS